MKNKKWVVTAVIELKFKFFSEHSNCKRTHVRIVEGATEESAKDAAILRCKNNNSPEYDSDIVSQKVVWTYVLDVSEPEKIELD